MSFLRFLMLLSLVIWIGGMIFFAFAVAPTVFKVLPTHHLAGQVVSRSLNILHGMGVVAGIVFLISSTIFAAQTTGSAQPFALRHILIMLMIVLTLVSVFAIARPMLALRNQMGVIDNVPQSDPRRVEFNRMHVWSTRVEGTVLLMGLVALWLTGKALG